MAGRGPTPKPPEERQRRNKPKPAPLALVGRIPPPTPPEGISEKWLIRWAEFWGSELARGSAAQTDLNGLEELFTLYDDRDTDRRRLRVLREAEGFTDAQVEVLSKPLQAHLDKLATQILNLEDRYGLNPRARLSLGLQLTQARRQLDDLLNEGGKKNALTVIDTEASGDQSDS